MLDLPLVQQTQQQIPSEEEARRFLNVLCNEPLQYEVFYVLAMFTGCRRGELCALKWSDFHLDGEQYLVTVSRSRSSVPGKGVVEGPTKNKHARTIILNPNVTSLVRHYCYTKVADAKKWNVHLSPYLFTDTDQSLIHPDTFTKHLRELLDDNDFPKAFHLHTLRHFYVSSLLHSGVDKQTVAELAGHGDTSFLERTYCHPQMECKQRAAAEISQTLLKSCFENSPVESATA